MENITYDMCRTVYIKTTTLIVQRLSGSGAYITGTVSVLWPVPRLTWRVYSWWNSLSTVLNVPLHCMSVNAQSRRSLSIVAYPIILFCG